MFYCGVIIGIAWKIHVMNNTEWKYTNECQWLEFSFHFLNDNLLDVRTLTDSWNALSDDSCPLHGAVSRSIGECHCRFRASRDQIVCWNTTRRLWMNVQVESIIEWTRKVVENWWFCAASCFRLISKKRIGCIGERRWCAILSLQGVKRKRTIIVKTEWV